MERVDTYPTHEHQGIKFRRGQPLPFGASIVPGGVNFSVFSKHATDCVLVLFNRHEDEPFAEIPFPDEFRIGNVFTMIVFDLDYENLEYGYKMDGPYEPEEGHRFDSQKILLDPYAKAVSGREIWGELPDWNKPFQHRSRVIFDDFDWEGDKPLEKNMEDLIIYEAHVRSLTRHESAEVKYPGTFAAIREKIPYFKELGINCLELLPVFEFDEFENSRINEDTGERLYNYWGYSAVNFFAPKAGFAATGQFGMEVDELKNLVKELHKNDIEVILDVVFNHTAEGNEKGPYISYRGVDNKTYYLLTPEGYYYNFSGCGNTLNCNNPVVRNMILDCLRYWASEYHIDGFRFDLASILARDQEGRPMANPPLLETLAHDPILGKCKLIAEAWDAGGLYQVGSFPDWGRWAEWNGEYRDDVRSFIKGEGEVVGSITQRIQGSPDLYAQRGPTASINFVTCHDGFTLNDLVSYNDKHNEANGENNRDGTDNNNSWNCGVEGPTNDPAIKHLRKKQMKNALTILLLSRGVPMFLAGDEFANTQYGNNNAYCQDNEISWLDWNLLEENKGLFRYCKNLLSFRKNHPVLTSDSFTSGTNATGYPEISFHGLEPWQADFSCNLTLGVLFAAPAEKYQLSADEFIYLALNMHWEGHDFYLPEIPLDHNWQVVANTELATPEDIWPAGEEKKLENQDQIYLSPRSAVILLGSK